MIPNYILNPYPYTHSKVQIPPLIKKRGGGFSLHRTFYFNASSHCVVQAGLKHFPSASAFQEVSVQECTTMLCSRLLEAILSLQKLEQIVQSSHDAFFP